MILVIIFLPSYITSNESLVTLSYNYSSVLIDKLIMMSYMKIMTHFSESEFTRQPV